VAKFKVVTPTGPTYGAKTDYALELEALRPLGARANAAGGTARHRRRCAHGLARLRKLALRKLAPRQMEKMPPCPVLGLDDPDIRIEPDFLGEVLFH